MSRLSAFSPRQRYLVSALVAAAAIASQPGCDRAKPAAATPPSSPAAAAPRTLSLGPTLTLSFETPDPLVFSVASLDAAGSPTPLVSGSFGLPSGTLGMKNTKLDLPKGTNLRIRLADAPAAAAGSTPKLEILSPADKPTELPNTPAGTELSHSIGANPETIVIGKTGGKFVILPRPSK